MEFTQPCGEFVLIDWIRGQQTGRADKGTILGIGDDCAILSVTSGSQLLVTTDMLLDGRHFQLAVDGAEAAGYKAMGVNLSDIAAMAGVPRAALVSVALPRHQDYSAIAQGLHIGLRRMADRFSVDLVGGDTNAWDGPLVINVAVLGETTSHGAIRRSGARPGDAILVTGPLGGSLFCGRHLRPEPRVFEALELARSATLSAMIDISDGLSSDLAHIVEESSVPGALLDAASIPIHPDAIDQSQIDGSSPLEHALHDGEDFELCIVCAPDEALKLLAAPPGGVTLCRIGEITSEQGVHIMMGNGLLAPIKKQGFDHFRTNSPSS
jgi:thiamine-monophosphate kinase